MQLTREQAHVAKILLREAKKLGASPKERKALIEAGLVESGLRNLNYGDRDSLGVLQQRPSMGWKSATDPAGAARDFLTRARAANVRGQSAGELAQAVQRSAFPSRYDERSGDADAILNGYGSTTGTPKKAGSSVPAADRQGLLLGYLAQRGKPGALLELAAGLKSAEVPTVYGKPKTNNPPRGNGRVKVDPAADREGVKTHPDVLNFLAEVSSIAGLPVRLGTGTRHSKLTVNGNVSQHWDGRAGDVPASGKRLVRLGQAALIAAGMPEKQARKQTGGLFNVGGVQVIFATDDHHDHLHVGLK